MERLRQRNEEFNRQRPRHRERDKEILKVTEGQRDRVTEGQ